MGGKKQVTGSKIAAIYCRKSREDRRDGDERALSIDAQIADGETLCKREGYQIGAVFTEPLNTKGKSFPSRWQEKDGQPPTGKRKRPQKERRPQLEALLQAIERGEIQVVVCRKRDRLARSLKLAIRLYEFFADHNVELHCTTEGKLGNDSTGRFTLKQLALIAEFQLDQSTENTLAAKKRAKELGLKMCRPQGLGWKDIPGAIEEARESAEVVREMFRRFNRGVSPMNLCRWLNIEYPHLAKPHHGKAQVWHPVSVYRILRNRRYIGQEENGGISKLYPRIVAPDTFWKAQELFASRDGVRVVSRTKERMAHNLPLRGVLFCGYCGKSLQSVGMTSAQKEIRLIACRAVELKHPHGYPMVMRESRWLEFIRAFFVHEVAPPPTEGTEAALLKSRLTGIDEEVGKLARQYARREMTLPAYTAATNELDKERQRTAEQIASLPLASRFFDESVGIDYVWENLDDDERRILVQRCVEKVIVYKDRAEVFVPGDEKPFIFPAMKERQFAKRPAACLCPPVTFDIDGTQGNFTPNEARDVMRDKIPVKLKSHKRESRTIREGWFKENPRRTPDWKKWLNDNFWLASDGAKHFISRKARKRHGLTGGKNYPGKKQKRKNAAS
jgi:DNA invertase Pin-like site-specific DNA recombinase